MRVLDWRVVPQERGLGQGDSILHRSGGVAASARGASYPSDATQIERSGVSVVMSDMVNEFRHPCSSLVEEVCRTNPGICSSRRLRALTDKLQRFQ